MKTIEEEWQKDINKGSPRKAIIGLDINPSWMSKITHKEIQHKPKIIITKAVNEVVIPQEEEEEAEAKHLWSYKIMTVEIHTSSAYIVAGATTLRHAQKSKRISKESKINSA